MAGRAGQLSRRRGLALLLVALALAGCSGGDDQRTEPRYEQSDLPRLVLQPADLTGPWSVFDEGRQLRSDAPIGDRADPRRFGRVDGWKARYRRAGSPQTQGPLVLESRADVFEDADGAQADLEAAVKELESAYGASAADAPGLGDAARVIATEAGAEGSARTLAVVWREENALAQLVAQGFTGRIELEDVLRLARRQQARIARLE